MENVPEVGLEPHSSLGNLATPAKTSPNRPDPPPVRPDPKPKMCTLCTPPICRSTQPETSPALPHLREPGSSLRWNFGRLAPSLVVADAGRQGPASNGHQSQPTKLNFHGGRLLHPSHERVGPHTHGHIVRYRRSKHRSFASTAILSALHR